MDVMVAGFASGSGASRRLLTAALDEKLRLLLSTPLLIGYEAVFTAARCRDEEDEGRAAFPCGCPTT